VPFDSIHYVMVLGGLCASASFHHQRCMPSGPWENEFLYSLFNLQSELCRPCPPSISIATSFPRNFSLSLSTQYKHKTSSLSFLHLLFFVLISHRTQSSTFPLPLSILLIHQAQARYLAHFATCSVAILQLHRLPHLTPPNPSVDHFLYIVPLRSLSQSCLSILIQPLHTPCLPLGHLLPMQLLISS
jgi:hypothetical protein